MNFVKLLIERENEGKGKGKVKSKKLEVRSGKI